MTLNTSPVQQLPAPANGQHSPLKHSCAHRGMVQSAPPQPFSHVQVLGSVQLPLLGHLRYWMYLSPGLRGGVVVPFGSPMLTPSARSSVNGALMGSTLFTSAIDCQQMGSEQSWPSHPGAHTHCGSPRNTNSTHHSNHSDRQHRSFTPDLPHTGRLTATTSSVHTSLDEPRARTVSGATHVPLLKQPFRT